jgi:predicted TIM-barrel fold metal-dependent hydrolase
MATIAHSTSSALATRATDRYIVVSTDSHAGPTLEGQLREYCPKQYLDAFDDFAREIRAVSDPSLDPATLRPDQAAMRHRGEIGEDAAETEKLAFARVRECGGQYNPDDRAKHMDADGVAVDVIFGGGQNGEYLPFVGFGTDAGAPQVSKELRAVGGHIWNTWLADFVSVHPERHVGVLNVPIWDIEGCIKEITWAKNAGLKAVNLPAPRSDYLPFCEPEYDPLWACCQDLELPLVTHSGGGEWPVGFETPNGWLLYAAERHWLDRRGLWQLISGGAFERFPRLNIVFTEQRVSWVPQTLRDLDSEYFSVRRNRPLPKPPSEYWFSNCYLSGSFLARYEVEMRHEVGLKNLMWGTDYPHREGTWPYTRVAMRNTLHGLPEDEVRMILGLNAIPVFHLDEQALGDVADRIGPTPAEIARAPKVSELPDPADRGLAFREIGNFS